VVNKELIESFVEDIFNKHDILATEKYFVKDSTTGGEGFKQFISALFKAFPDMHTKIEHIIAENDFVVVFLNGNETHTGEFHGKQPTNRRVNVRSTDLYRIENEKIVEHWDPILDIV
jgi:predicted ester cyclase